MGDERGAGAEDGGGVDPDSHVAKGSVYLWAGRQNRLPQDFVLPATRLHEGWLRWWLGVPGYDTANELSICAYRFINDSDFGEKNERKKFSDWRNVMQWMVRVLREKCPTCFVANPTTVTQVDDMYRIVIRFVPKVKRGAKRKTNESELKITTIIKRIREAKYAPLVVVAPLANV